MRARDRKLLQTIDYTPKPQVRSNMFDGEKTFALVMAAALARLSNSGHIGWSRCPATMREGYVLTPKGRAALKEPRT
jgi:hypothetical protein